MSIGVVASSSVIDSTPTGPTRVYFPSAGTPPANPANDAAWNAVASPAALPLVTTPGATADTFVAMSESSATANWKVLARKFVSTDTIATARTIDGTMSGESVAYSIDSTGAASVYLVVRVVSGDGATVRGTLFAGSVSGVPGSGVRTGYVIGNQTLNPVAAQAGDRIEIQAGANFGNVSTASKGARFYHGDAPADVPAGTNGTATSGRMWVEFSATLFA